MWPTSGSTALRSPTQALPRTLHLTTPTPTPTPHHTHTHTTQSAHTHDAHLKLTQVHVCTALPGPTPARVRCWQCRLITCVGTWTQQPRPDLGPSASQRATALTTHALDDVGLGLVDGAGVVVTLLVSEGGGGDVDADAVSDTVADSDREDDTDDVTLVDAVDDADVATVRSTATD